MGSTTEPAEAPSEDGSVSGWIDALKAGDSVAAQRLWDRYFSQLVAIANAKLGSRKQEADGEDIALSAMKSVMIGVKADRYPELSGRDGLWPLLVTITARKSLDQVRRQQAKKRRGVQLDDAALRSLVGAEPSPEFVLAIAENLDRLVDQFDDPTLREIAMQKLAGETDEEIAKLLGVSVRTIGRKIKRIRQEWEVAEGHREGEAPNGRDA